MFIKTFPVGVFQCNCTVIADQGRGEAIVIDPGDEAQKIVDAIRREKFTVKYILHTHAHIDHIGATNAVFEACAGEVCLHKADMPLYENIDMQAEFLGLPGGFKTTPVTKFIEHGDLIECHAALKTEVIFTPGHTPGSVCFSFDTSVMGKPLLFSGDTLFLNSIGRTDLWGGDYGQILASIKEKLFILPPDTVVIPGHGPATQIAHERRNNPFCKGHL